MLRSRLPLAIAFLLALALPPASVRLATAQSNSPLNRFNHIVVVYQENRGFDALYGWFPGADGLRNATNAFPQMDRDGNSYSVLPQPLNSTLQPPGPDPRFPANLAVQPFDLGDYVAPEDRTGDLVHRYYQEQLQIDGGRMDKWLAWTDSAGLVMGYYDGTNMPEGKLAQDYVLADNFFHGAFGGSFLNHFFFVCACPPQWQSAPDSIRAQVGPDGSLIKDGQATADGFGINTSYTINTPHPANVTDTSLLVPEQTQPTIGDRLSEKDISWKWYSGGWNDAVAGHPDPLFQFHHQTFAFFQNYADGTPGRAAHLKDEADFFSDLSGGSLPAVSFIKPIGADNEHPGYASLARGQQHVADVVNAVQATPYWDDTLIVVTYDENGGSWDHVAPPTGDRWGPGSRVPTLLIAPFSKHGYVDHTQYVTESILATIEHRWDLAPLGTHDAQANDFTNALMPVRSW